MSVEKTTQSQNLSSYDREALTRHFDEYGIREWERLVETPAHEVSLYLHTHYLEKYLSRGSRVLEIGAGAGRFTQVLARLGAQIIVADISSVQLDLNRKFAQELGFSQSVVDRQQVDVCDLSRYDANSLDAVIAYGGVFSYVLDQRDQALSECLRVLRSGGLLFLSVMSVWGSAHLHLDNVLELPPETNQKITSTGDISPQTLPDRKGNFMHMFRAGELAEWLQRNGLILLDRSASACLSLTWDTTLEQIKSDREKWAELLRIELEACADPGCLNMGTHIIAVAQKPF
jgi:2-polyprenyl-3-methyl-5-hydroxy-6-metoxy-1,4-benzoquinol methylase